MNGYKAFYRGKTTEIYAETSYSAQQKAAAHFKAKKTYDVSVMLCEKETDGSAPGQQVTHVATF